MHQWDQCMRTPVACQSRHGHQYQPTAINSNQQRHQDVFNQSRSLLHLFALFLLSTNCCLSVCRPEIDSELLYLISHFNFDFIPSAFSWSELAMPPDLGWCAWCTLVTLGADFYIIYVVSTSYSGTTDTILQSLIESVLFNLNSTWLANCDKKCFKIWKSLRNCDDVLHCVADISSGGRICH